MTSEPSDEDVLIEAARAERGQHRSGRSMVVTLAVAALFGVAGAVLVFLPQIVSWILPGPLSLIGFLGLPILFTLGIVAFLIAGFFLLAAFASSPIASWGSKVAGNCPQCGEPGLRSDTVPGLGGAALAGGLRGIVTLCETARCGYATARVTSARR